MRGVSKQASGRRQLESEGVQTEGERLTETERGGVEM